MFGHDIDDELVVQELEHVPRSTDNNELINYKLIDKRFEERKEVGQCFLVVGLLYTNIQQLEHFDVTGTVTSYLESTPNFMKNALQLNVLEDFLVDISDQEVEYRPSLYITDIDKAVVVNLLKHNPYMFC